MCVKRLCCVRRRGRDRKIAVRTCENTVALFRVTNGLSLNVCNRTVQKNKDLHHPDEALDRVTE